MLTGLGLGVFFPGKYCKRHREIKNIVHGTPKGWQGNSAVTLQLAGLLQDRKVGRGPGPQSRVSCTPQLTPSQGSPVRRRHSWAAATRGAGREGLKSGFSLICVCVEGPEAPMGAAASSEPPQRSNQSCKERSPAGSGTTELPRQFHRQRVCIPVFHSSWACWSTCSAVAQAGQAGALQQQRWIPAGKQPSPCTRGSGTRSSKGASLTRQCLNRGWDILSRPLALPGAALCSGWHHHCQWPRLSWWSSFSGRS